MMTPNEALANIATLAAQAARAPVLIPLHPGDPPVLMAAQKANLNDDLDTDALEDFTRDCLGKNVAKGDALNPALVVAWATAFGIKESHLRLALPRLQQSLEGGLERAGRFELIATAGLAPRLARAGQRMIDWKCATVADTYKVMDFLEGVEKSLGIDRNTSWKGLTESAGGKSLAAAADTLTALKDKDPIAFCQKMDPAHEEDRVLTEIARLSARFGESKGNPMPTTTSGQPLFVPAHTLDPTLATVVADALDTFVVKKPAAASNLMLNPAAIAEWAGRMPEAFMGSSPLPEDRAKKLVRFVTAAATMLSGVGGDDTANALERADKENETVRKCRTLREASEVYKLVDELNGGKDEKKRADFLDKLKKFSEKTKEPETNQRELMLRLKSYASTWRSLNNGDAPRALKEVLSVLGGKTELSKKEAEVREQKEVREKALEDPMAAPVGAPSGHEGKRR